MNMKPSAQRSNPGLRNDGLRTPADFSLSTALYHPASLLAGWQAPHHVQSAERHESETASPVHVVFAALMAVASVLLVVLTR